MTPAGTSNELDVQNEWEEKTHTCIYSRHQGRWTYQPGSHRRKVAQDFYSPSFCGACLNFSREKNPVIPFPRRPSSRILYTNGLIVLHLLDIFIYFYFLVRKNPVYRDSNSRPNVSEGYEVTSELPGRPAST